MLDLMPPAQKSKKSFYARHKNEIVSYGFLLIPIALWFAFLLVPLCMAISYSFSNLELSPSLITRYGFFQYAKVLRDTEFWKSIKVSLIWTVAMTIGNNALGFLIAFAVSRLKKWRRMFLALLFWPILVSAVVGALIIRMVFGPYDNSVMNIVISWFGRESVHWLTTERTALFSLMALPLILGFSVKMIIFYAAIVSIPSQYFEAAKLDTAKNWRIVWHIVLPLVKNIVVLNILLSIIGEMKVLGPMLLVTNGIAGTTSVMLYIYQLAFQMPAKGQATAASFIVFIIIFILSLIQLKLSGKAGANHE